MGRVCWLFSHCRSQCHVAKKSPKLTDHMEQSLLQHILARAWNDKLWIQSIWQIASRVSGNFFNKTRSEQILLNKYGYGNSHYFSLFAYNNQMVLRCGWIKKRSAHSFDKTPPLTWVGVNWTKDSGDHGHNTYSVFLNCQIWAHISISRPQNFYGPS
jgi:hypothetical protein